LHEGFEEQNVIFRKS